MYFWCVHLQFQTKNVHLWKAFGTRKFYWKLKHFRYLIVIVFWLNSYYLSSNVTRATNTILSRHSKSLGFHVDLISFSRVQYRRCGKYHRRRGFQTTTVKNWNEQWTKRVQRRSWIFTFIRRRYQSAQYFLFIGPAGWINDKLRSSRPARLRLFIYPSRVTEIIIISPRQKLLRPNVAAAAAALCV